MNGRRVLGAALASIVALPPWVILLVDRPGMSWLNTAVSILYAGFAVLIGSWVTQHPRGRTWLVDQGAVATWTGFGGLIAAPAMILQVAPALALVALAALAVIITVLSPVLSVRAGEVLERLVAPPPDVLRPLPKLNEYSDAVPSSLVRIR